MAGKTGKNLGYTKVSAKTEPAQVLGTLKAAACDKIFLERISGKEVDRAVFQQMLALVQSGDTVTFHKLADLGRSLPEVVRTAADLIKRGAQIVVIEDGYDTSKPNGKEFVKLMTDLAAFEQEVTQERVKTGIANARKRGQKFGRPAKIDQERLHRILELADAGIPYGTIANMEGVDKSTVYRNVKQRTINSAKIIQGEGESA